jgi:hypothetical protein
MELTKSTSQQSASIDSDAEEQEQVERLSAVDLLRNDIEGLIPHIEYLINMINVVRISAHALWYPKLNYHRQRKTWMQQTTKVFRLISS